MNEESMTKTYAVTVRWPAVAERVEYIDAASVEEACDLVMRGEAKDLGDLEYHDDIARAPWIEEVQDCESDDPRAAPVLLPVPVAFQLKEGPSWMADDLLCSLRQTWRALNAMTGPQRMTPAVLDALEHGQDVIRRAEEAQPTRDDSVVGDLRALADGEDDALGSLLNRAADEIERLRAKAGEQC